MYLQKKNLCRLKFQSINRKKPKGKRILFYSLLIQTVCKTIFGCTMMGTDN